jgi:hypothetical protein
MLDGERIELGFVWFGKKRSAQTGTWADGSLREDRYTHRSKALINIGA